MLAVPFGSCAGYVNCSRHAVGWIGSWQENEVATWSKVSRKEFQNNIYKTSCHYRSITSTSTYERHLVIPPISNNQKPLLLQLTFHKAVDLDLGRRIRHVELHSAVESFGVVGLLASFLSLHVNLEVFRAR